MGDLTTAEKITLLNTVVSSTCQDLYTEYSQIRGNSAADVTNSNVLSAKKRELQAQLDELKRQAEANNTEFADRLNSGDGKISFWQARGLTTLQDRVLAAFFSSYVFAVFVLLIYIFMYSTTKLQGVLFTLFFAGVIALLIAMVLIRLA
jgi:hypothetical protein